MRVRRSLITAGAILLTLTGCASAGGSGGGGGGGGGSGDTVTTDELAEVGGGTVFAAVRRLRPRWLRSRGGGPRAVVFVDGAERGGLDELRSISVTTVRRIRFVDGRTATMRHGRGYGGGIIEVTTR